MHRLSLRTALRAPSRGPPVFLAWSSRHIATSRTSSPSVCPSCGSPLPTPLPACPKCFHIERMPNEQDFYQILDTPTAPNPFIVDPARLKNSFRNIQRYIHPDVWTPQGEGKVNAARDLSSLVNKAYNTLLQPVSRVQYILQQHGFNVSETDQLDDKELILEVMEAREALEDAASEEDAQAIREQNYEKFSSTLQQIETLVGSQDWEGARRAAVRLKYLQGIDEAAKSWPHAPFDH